MKEAVVLSFFLSKKGLDSRERGGREGRSEDSRVQGLECERWEDMGCGSH